MSCFLTVLLIDLLHACAKSELDIHSVMKLIHSIGSNQLKSRQVMFVKEVVL